MSRSHKNLSQLSHSLIHHHLPQGEPIGPAHAHSAVEVHVVLGRTSIVVTATTVVFGCMQVEGSRGGYTYMYRHT